MKAKIRLDTFTDARTFVNIVSALDGHITITDNAGLCINAKSTLGVLYSLEFAELWCESDKDIRSKISAFIINE